MHGIERNDFDCGKMHATTTSAVVGRAIHAGQTVDQMKEAKLLAPWSAKYSNDFVTADIFIETLYNSLTHQQHTPFVKHN